jgi:putative DNA modification/repair radical SAM protein
VETLEKLAVLADAAKYDASCASSGAPKRDSAKTGGVGSTGGMGICHSYAPDGRCISLLKILLTNFCVFDCAYCVNRRTSNVQRARFTPQEVVDLTLAFYKRNYIEGLFLSSGIIRDPDYTMGQLVAVARTLREEHRFGGYIHLKTIPDAAPELLAEAGRWADRLSINVELPTEAGLARLAPEKKLPDIRASMGRLRLRIDESRAEKRAPRFAPAGQSTQMIVGADAADDATILATSANLYASYGLRRVYYSAFSPIPDASSVLPLAAPPLRRENRLYQADWLLRYYGFAAGEIVARDGEGNANLDLELDPKHAWALRNRERFPVHVQTAAREVLLRVPGFGVRNVDRMIALRRLQRIRLADLAALRVGLRKALPFIETDDHRPAVLGEPESDTLRQRFLRPRQADLFG